MRFFQLLTTAFSEAFHALRAKPLHTLLSLLGIIIGVGALVSILALGDGMEKFGRDQIEKTTNLNSIQIAAAHSTFADGIRIQKQNPSFLSLSDLDSIKAIAKDKARTEWFSFTKSWIKITKDTSLRPSNVMAIHQNALSSLDTVLFGNMWNDSLIKIEPRIALINKSLALRLSEDTNRIDLLLNRSITLDSTEYKITGIVHSARDIMGQSTLIIPVKSIAENKLKSYSTTIAVTSDKTEDVQALKKEIENYYDKLPRKKSDYSITSNEFRVDQLRRGILLFKSIMGLIVGISILVGGIGIMNVLLMSVTERTREIGIRKALGAKPKEIAFQFMAEAMTISLMGSIIGILFGMLTLTIALPIIKKILNGDIIKVSYEMGSMLVILIIALFIGLVFGTYPAYKASKQSPIDAIRVE